VSTSDGQRAVAFGRQLRRAHQHLSDQLAGIRGQLGENAGEDGGMFTDLLDARPDLAPAIQKLIDDHTAMAAILLRVRTLATQAKTTPAQGLPGLRRELDGLAAIAESHFRYEERAVSAALDNDVTDTGWSRPVFSPTEPPRRVTGHGLHGDSGGREELADLGCVLDDVQRHAADNHRE
jgi:hypothetical protein